MIEITKYMCALCASEHHTAQEAEFCEALGRPENGLEVGSEVTYTHQESGDTRTGKISARYILRFSKDSGYFHQFAYIVPNNESSWRIVLPVVKEDGTEYTSSDTFGVYISDYRDDMVAHYHKLGVYIDG